MRQRLFLYIFVTSILFFSGCDMGTTSSVDEDGSPIYSNPLLARSADPWVYKHSDGYYYFTSTYDASSSARFDRIQLRRAKTINGLRTAAETTIWSAHTDSDGMNAYIWAPELHYIDGAWYIYFAASTSLSSVWSVREYAIRCTDDNPLTGTWEELGRIYTHSETFSLDGTTFELNGTRYYVWSQYRTNNSVTYACIYIAEMSNPYTLKDTSEVTLISTPQFDWEKQTYNVNEGPAVLIRNGKVFIVYSASACDSTYCMGMLTASADSNLLEASSWTKSASPIFKSSESASVYGPGHCSFTTDGDNDVLVYHGRAYPGLYTSASLSSATTDALSDPFRATYAQIFTWNADGTPNFGSPK